MLGRNEEIGSQRHKLIDHMQWNIGGESSSWRGRRKIDELARELEPTVETIRQWIKQAELARRGVAVGERDLMIGATAIAKDYAIATRDERSFPKIPGLKARQL